jgi:repressor LexA
MLPLKGLITAGAPIEAVETNETMAVPSEMVANGEDAYVLKVKGDSMIEDGILSGDYVVVVGSSAPKDGDTVVALLENNYATLKRFYKEKGRVRLQPANRTMQPIYVNDIIVQGVVRGVIRDYRRA